MRVLKFGGSSIALPERIKSVIEIVLAAKKEHGNIALVFSAFGGVTDQLIKMGTMAASGQEEYKALLLEVEKRHLNAVKALVGVKHQAAVLANVKTLINDLEDLLHGLYFIREFTPRTVDTVMSFGERLSAYIITESFKDRKADAEFLDSRKVIVTDDHFGSARVDFDATNKKIKEYFKNRKSMQVITGFIASTENNEITTLGRSGSDYTASIFAAALKADEVEIWTDVDGMMTADPRKVKRAFPVKSMSYEEAMEISHFGAKVIFPATMQPVMLQHIPIRVKNTFNPSFEGTVISANPAASNGGMVVKGISSIENMCLLRLQGSGMVGVVGVSMRLFAALAHERVNVILISQASSEHSICIAIDFQSSQRAKKAIDREFAYEISTGNVDPAIVECDKSIIAVVGEGMKHYPGISARMFSALGKNGINIFAIAQGSSELNISVVIDQADEVKALNALHEGFFLSDKKSLHVFLVGTGLIGGILFSMIRKQFKKLSDEHNTEINVVGMANSRKMVFDENGITSSDWKKLLNDKGFPMKMNDFVDRMNEMNLANSVFVDCTASDQVVGFYEKILKSSISIVTPNKRANSGSWDQYQRLKNSAQRTGVRFLYETNVGAGLPVINTLNDLLYSGDRVIKMEAVLSGTMNYLFSSYEEGMKFSDIVKDAKKKGFTEPDPRDDLSGMDVARKILILARETGLNLEMKDIEVESMVPENCKKVPSVDEFFVELEKSNNFFEKRLQEAKKKGQKLRYMASLADGKAKVSLQGAGVDHPFYPLKGSDNIISFTTERYHEQPLVVKGPGAGGEVTAAGVFADIIRISNYLS